MSYTASVRFTHQGVINDSLQLKQLAAWQHGYFATTGVYIVILVMLFVNRMQFHPALGVVSRSLRLAVGDLTSFLFLLACLVSMYTIIGHSIFGVRIEGFSSLHVSFETCIHSLLGDVSVVAETRELTDPVRTIGVAY